MKVYVVYSEDEGGAPFVGATLEKAVVELSAWAATQGKVVGEVTPVTKLEWQVDLLYMRPEGVKAYVGDTYLIREYEVKP